MTGFLRALLLVPIVLIAALRVAAADVEAGMAAYQRGDHAAALAAFKEAAEKGDARGQYNLGVLYLTGQGTTRDLDQAVAWHRRAADRGLAAAQHGLGLLYYQGQGVERDHKQAATWFRKAADQGMADAQYNLGVMYGNGEGVDENMAEVVKWISLSAGQGFAPAQLRLGIMYQDGIGLPRDRAEALKWFRRAAAAGNEDAAARMRALAARAAADAEDAKPIGTAVPLTAEQPTGEPPEPLAAKPDPKPVETPPAVATAPAKPDAPPAATATPKPTPPTTEAAPPPATPERKTAPKAGPASKPTTAKAAGTAAAPAGGWRIQLAAYRDAAQAEAAWKQLVAQRTALFDGIGPHVERADLGPKGVFHRLQAGPLRDRSSAQALCQRVRAALPGQPCMIVPPRRGG